MLHCLRTQYTGGILCGFEGWELVVNFGTIIIDEVKNLLRIYSSSVVDFPDTPKMTSVCEGGVICTKAPWAKIPILLHNNSASSMEWVVNTIALPFLAAWMILHITGQMRNCLGLMPYLSRAFNHTSRVAFGRRGQGRWWAHPGKQFSTLLPWKLLHSIFASFLFDVSVRIILHSFH